MHQHWPSPASETYGLVATANDPLLCGPGITVSLWMYTPGTHHSHEPIPSHLPYFMYCHLYPFSITNQWIFGLPIAPEEFNVLATFEAHPDSLID